MSVCQTSWCNLSFLTLPATLAVIAVGCNAASKGNGVIADRARISAGDSLRVGTNRDPERTMTTQAAELIEPAQSLQVSQPNDDVRAQDVPSTADSGPTLREPGPDSPDFPDSAFTVPPGVVYVETSITHETSKGPRFRDYSTDTLVRVGMCENLELRISNPGLIHQDGPVDDTTGFGPTTFGFKRHIWAEDERSGLPAIGVIAQVTTPTASAGFDNGAAEPTVYFNFDHSLPADFAFEWNLGISWLKGSDGERFLQGEVLWVLSRELADELEGFVHGIVDFPAGSGEQEELVVGPGMLWFVSGRLALDFSYNFGLTAQSPHRIVRFGLSMAF